MEFKEASRFFLTEWSCTGVWLSWASLCRWFWWPRERKLIYGTRMTSLLKRFLYGQSAVLKSEVSAFFSEINPLLLDKIAIIWSIIVEHRLSMYTSHTYTNAIIKSFLIILKSVSFFIRLIDVTFNCFYWRFASADAASGSSSSSCRYVKGQWSECDSNTNLRSRTLNLKKGDKSCEQTKIIQKKCKKGKSRH